MATRVLSNAMVRDITMLMNDDTARPKLRRFISALKKERKQTADEAKQKFKAQLKADLKEALQELRDENEGKVQLKDARELLYELQN